MRELGGKSFLAHNVKTASRLKVLEAFAKSRTPLNITLELATVETIKRFVQREVGLAFVPRMCVTEELERGTLASAPVRGLSYTRRLWATHRRGAATSHAAAAFLEVLREHARAQGLSVGGASRLSPRPENSTRGSYCATAGAWVKGFVRKWGLRPRVVEELGAWQASFRKLTDEGLLRTFVRYTGRA